MARGGLNKIFEFELPEGLVLGEGELRIDMIYGGSFAIELYDSIGNEVTRARLG